MNIMAVTCHDTMQAHLGSRVGVQGSGLKGYDVQGPGAGFRAVTCELVETPTESC